MAPLVLSLLVTSLLLVASSLSPVVRADDCPADGLIKVAGACLPLQSQLPGLVNTLTELNKVQEKSGSYSSSEIAKMKESASALCKNSDTVLNCLKLLQKCPNVLSMVGGLAAALPPNLSELIGDGVTLLTTQCTNKALILYFECIERNNGVNVRQQSCGAFKGMSFGDFSSSFSGFANLLPGSKPAANAPPPKAAEPLDCRQFALFSGCMASAVKKYCSKDLAESMYGVSKIQGKANKPPCPMPATGEAAEAEYLKNAPTTAAAATTTKATTAKATTAAKTAAPTAGKATTTTTEAPAATQAATSKVNQTPKTCKTTSTTIPTPKQTAKPRPTTTTTPEPETEEPMTEEPPTQATVKVPNTKPIPSWQFPTRSTPKPSKRPTIRPYDSCEIIFPMMFEETTARPGGNRIRTTTRPMRRTMRTTTTTTPAAPTEPQGDYADYSDETVTMSAALPAKTLAQWARVGSRPQQQLDDVAAAAPTQSGLSSSAQKSSHRQTTMSDGIAIPQFLYDWSDEDDRAHRSDNGAVVNTAAATWLNVVISLIFCLVLSYH